MLLTAEEAMASAGGRTGTTDLPGPDDAGRRPEHGEDLDADSVFAKLKSLKNDNADRD
jgi:hypothetical protein